MQGKMSFLTCAEQGYWQLLFCFDSYWCKKPWRGHWIGIVTTACSLPMIPEKFPSSCCVCTLVSCRTKWVCGGSILRNIQNTAGHGPVQPDPGSSYSSRATVGNVWGYCFKNKSMQKMESINLAMLLATKMSSKTSTVRLRGNKPVSTEWFLTTIFGLWYVYQNWLNPSSCTKVKIWCCSLQTVGWKKLHGKGWHLFEKTKKMQRKDFFLLQKFIYSIFKYIFTTGNFWV